MFFLFFYWRYCSSSFLKRETGLFLFEEPAENSNLGPPPTFPRLVFSHSYLLRVMALSLDSIPQSPGKWPHTTKVTCDTREGCIYPTGYKKNSMRSVSTYKIVLLHLQNFLTNLALQIKTFWTRVMKEMFDPVAQFDQVSQFILTYLQVQEWILNHFGSLSCCFVAGAHGEDVAACH